MSFGTQPSTMTVDPTPPGLRPMQNQLVQMLMSRLSGGGRASVPTYGSNMPNVQQQLYGMNPRTPSTQVRGMGSPGSYPQGNVPIQPPNPVPSQPRTPISGSGGATPFNTPAPVMAPPTYGNAGEGPRIGTGQGPMNMPPTAIAPPADAQPWGMQYPGIPTMGQAGGGLLSANEYRGPNGYQNAQGQWVVPQQTTPPPISPLQQMPQATDMSELTRGGPTGIMQGGQNPWTLPTYGNVMNGSGLIRAMSNPYGYF